MAGEPVGSASTNPVSPVEKVVGPVLDKVVAGPVGKAIEGKIVQGMNQGMEDNLVAGFKKMHEREEGGTDVEQMRANGKGVLAGETRGQKGQDSENLTIKDRFDRIVDGFKQWKSAALAVIMEGQMVVDDVRMTYLDLKGRHDEAEKIRAQYRMAPTEPVAKVAQMEEQADVFSQQIELMEVLQKYQEGNRRFAEMVAQTSQFTTWLGAQSTEMYGMPASAQVFAYENEKPEQMLDILNRFQRQISPQDENLNIALNSHLAAMTIKLEPSFMKGYAKELKVTVPNPPASSGMYLHYSYADTGKGEPGFTIFQPTTGQIDTGPLSPKFNIANPITPTAAPTATEMPPAPEVPPAPPTTRETPRPTAPLTPPAEKAPGSR